MVHFCFMQVEYFIHVLSSVSCELFCMIMNSIILSVPA